jgi:hypothetical protein
MFPSYSVLLFGMMCLLPVVDSLIAHKCGIKFCRVETILYQRVLPRECCLWLTSNTHAITEHENSTFVTNTLKKIVPPFAFILELHFHEVKISNLTETLNVLWVLRKARTRRMKARRTVGRLSTKINLTLLYEHCRLTIKDSTLCE